MVFGGCYNPLGLGASGGHSSTLSIRVCAAKRLPFVDFSLTKDIHAFSGIPSHKGYALSAFLSHKGCFFSEICSKPHSRRKCLKKSSAKMFHQENPQKSLHRIFLTKSMVFHNFSLTKGMLFPYFSLTEGPIVNIDAAHTYHFWTGVPHPWPLGIFWSTNFRN